MRPERLTVPLKNGAPSTPFAQELCWIMLILINVLVYVYNKEKEVSKPKDLQIVWIGKYISVSSIQMCVFPLFSFSSQSISKDIYT